MLVDAYDSREADNIFKFVLEDFFNLKYIKLKEHFLSETEVEELNYIFEKVCNHYPIQYIFNKAYFYGLEFYVDKNVLIPRPETEELVHLILSQNNATNINVLDIGTGSGCIAIALQKNKPNWNLFAIDVSDDALNIAKNNAGLAQVEVAFLKQDILQKIEWNNLAIENFNTIKLPNKFDIIVSNPPYIPMLEIEKMSASTVLHEPHLALFVEDDNPLLFYEKIANFALENLTSTGILYFELNEFNAADVCKILDLKGFKQIEIIKDMAGKNRMLSAKR